MLHWINSNEAKVIGAIDDIARYIVTELNYFVKGKGGDEGYDYKSSFKSQTDVHTPRDEILKAYEKDINSSAQSLSRYLSDEKVLVAK